jgi:hypothetical protein
MILYERRIESSLHKTMHELERQQLVRQFQQQDENEQQSAQAIPKACGFEAATRPEEKQVDLKKQSQFVPGVIGAKSFMKGAYGNNSPAGDEPNKAKLIPSCRPGEWVKEKNRTLQRILSRINHDLSEFRC